MYKLEIFTDQMNFSDAALIEEQTIDLDYITFDAFTLVSTPVKCQKGYFVHVTAAGSLVCDGVVSDVQPGTGTVSISVRPMQALFDCEVFPSPINDVVTWMEGQIREQFMENPDTLQNRPVIVNQTVRTAYPLTVSDGETVKLLDIMAAALTTYGIVCDCRLDMAALKVSVDIYQPVEEMTIEADLKNVLEKSVTLGDSYGAANKMVARKTVTDPDTGAVTYPEQRAYYLHHDGTVDDLDTNRITPVFWVLKDVSDSETWDRDALAAAVEALTPQQFDNEIVLTYAAEDNLVYPASIPIGTRAKIYVDGTAYSSILTGKTIKQGTISLTFGQVRVALTKRLILERRSK